MVSKKYVETLFELLEIWFTNKKQLADYDFKMLKELASKSLNYDLNPKKEVSQ